MVHPTNNILVPIMLGSRGMCIPRSDLMGYKFPCQLTLREVAWICLVNMWRWAKLDWRLFINMCQSDHGFCGVDMFLFWLKYNAGFISDLHYAFRRDIIVESKANIEDLMNKIPQPCQDPCGCQFEWYLVTWPSGLTLILLTRVTDNFVPQLYCLSTAFTCGLSYCYHVVLS